MKHTLHTSDPKKQKLFRRIFLSAAALIALFCITICIIGLFKGVFSSTERFAEVIKSWGMLGYIGFVILEILSIIVVILPCSLGYPAATLAYGPLISFILNTIAALSASIIIFIIVRRFGKPLVDSIVEKKHIDKYEKLLDKTPVFEKILALTLFVPFLPDNGLCYLAGLTKMDFRKFSFLVIVLKPWKILFYTYGFSFLFDKITEFVSGLIH